MCAKIGSRFQMGPGQKVAAGAALLAALAGLVHLVIRAMSGDTRRGEGRRGGSLGMCVCMSSRGFQFCPSNILSFPFLLPIPKGRHEGR